ncbi:MAG TPA: peptidylprolyl isomerase [Bacteroidales bacterium]|nr:peptidylprolyl isomerase [Bacteroidales bacterium]
MKIRSSILLVLLLLIPAVCRAQGLNDSTLMTIAGIKIEAGEFIRMYNKSYEPGKLPDPESYLQQYIVFRLKVADAISDGIDTTREFINELSGYRNQLAQNYLTDTKTREKLIQKMYDRSLLEINAYHILINCPEGAKPVDTLNAWNKAAAVKQRILRGESFEQVARSTSDDPSVRLNGGNLGYFTVFQMITPFEDAAYSLKKGSVSDPVRTPYGYHIIKVTDRKPSRGKILVAHIMKSAPPGITEKEEKEAEESINKIYEELLKGASFSELARKYSDHKQSAVNGGKLDWFGAGEIVTEFAEAAFSIRDTGQYTKPVRSSYGWHIIKLLDRKAPGSFEESRSYLESRINQSYLNSLSKRSFINTLKKEYKFRINPTVFNWFVSNTDTLIINGLSKYNRSSIPGGYLYSFADQRLSARDFAAYIEKRKSMIVTTDPAIFINRSIEAISNDQLIQYENSILEKKYPDFRYLINEFHDGILLFNISEKKIWSRAQEDSAGLIRYYDEHKDDFLTRKGIEASIYTLHLAGGDKKLASIYRKYSRRKEGDRLMIEKINGKNDSLLVITKKIWYEGDDPDLDKIQWIKGKQNIRMGNFPAIIIINRLIDPVPKPFSEVEAEMISGYQDYLEKEWIEQLRAKYTVKINDRIFNMVKKSLMDE